MLDYITRLLAGEDAFTVTVNTEDSKFRQCPVRAADALGIVLVYGGSEAVVMIPWTAAQAVYVQVA